MIHAKELRIGNLINAITSLESAPTGIVTISEICHDGIETDKYMEYAPDYPFGYSLYPFEGLGPIPLTPEILEKCGFEVKDKSFHSQDGKRHEVLFYLSPFFGDWKQNRLQCRFYDDRDPLWWLVAEVGPTPTGFTSLTRLPYLHQLQNLFFALNGHELTIKP
jgi:hypothetical protein